MKNIRVLSCLYKVADRTNLTIHQLAFLAACNELERQKGGFKIATLSEKLTIKTMAITKQMYALKDRKYPLIEKTNTKWGLHQLTRKGRQIVRQIDQFIEEEMN